MDFAERYQSYLVSGPANERALVDEIEAQIETPMNSFNLADLVRQVADSDLDTARRRQIDRIVTAAINAVKKDKPLRPCPGIAVATYLANPPPMPVLNTWAGSIVYGTEEGRSAFTERLKGVTLAANWENSYWLEEAVRLYQAYEGSGLVSPIALAAWMTHTARTRMMYARLCAAAAHPGTLPREESEKIAEALRIMVKQDPTGGKDYVIDPYMLLSQRVYRNSG